MLEGIDAVTRRVFIPVEVMLEWPVVPVDQFGVFALQPVFGIAHGKGPAHDIEAFVDNLTVRQDKHRKCSLG